MKPTQNKPAQKKVIKESIWNEIVQMWNDSSPAYNTGISNSEMTKGEEFKAIVGVILGIPAVSLAGYHWDKIKNYLSKVPEKAKKVAQAFKIVKGTESPEEVEQKVSSELGVNVNLKEAARANKIRKIKALVERVEKRTGKKVVFVEASTPNKQTFDGVKKDTPQKALENWASGKQMPKGVAPKSTASEIMKSLKESGFEIVPASKVEKTPSKVNEAAKKPLAKKFVPMKKAETPVKKK